MPVRIRLSRAGTNKRPFYRIVIADSRRARNGKFIFPPLTPQKNINMYKNHIKIDFIVNRALIKKSQHGVDKDLNRQKTILIKLLKRMH